MQWHEIREHYPHQWVLIEALEAHSAEGQRILDDIAVVQPFPDWPGAWEGYKSLHQKDPARELYVLHTDRERLDIGEIRWLGVANAPGERISCPRPRAFRHLLERALEAKLGVEAGAV